MERENYDIDEILALSINEENASTSSEESEPEADSNPGLRLNGTIWYV